MQLQTLRLVKTGRVSEKENRYNNPSMVFTACRDMANLDREHFVVLHLDGKNSVIARETVSIGSLNQTIVEPREVFKAAVHNGSASIICVHNHPSGDPDPSDNDIFITERLRCAGELIGINLLDHIIIGDNRYFSMVDGGYFRTGPVGPVVNAPVKREPTPEQQRRLDIGRCVRALRTEMGMKQKDLSQKTGILQTYLSQIENGHKEITKDEAEKISSALNNNILFELTGGAA
jgi:DNA repair protein RadC